jgi:hypothetical protein
MPIPLALLLPAIAAPLPRRVTRALGRAFARIATCLACVRRGYAVSARYEELAKLSETERERCGIARGDLLRHIGDELGKS